jgi:excisionase family DNA binding protein
MTGFISVKEFAEKHGMERSNILRLIKQGRLTEAEKIGNQWCIPADTPRPEDRRVKSGKYKNWRKKPEA